MTRHVILLLEKCGFHVLCVSTDNNKVNQKMFRLLSKDSTECDTLCFPEINHPIYFGYDTVHIMKSIRNNWINMKDSEKTFIIPTPHFSSTNLEMHIDGHTQNCSILGPIIKAKFGDIRNVYKPESKSLLKKASFEKQKVSLALNVFDESTYSALLCFGHKDTDNFVEMIWKWWSVVNTHSVVLAKLKNNSWGLPFTSLSDERLVFLEKFAEWVENWCFPDEDEIRQSLFPIVGKHYLASLTKDISQVGIIFYVNKNVEII